MNGLACSILPLHSGALASGTVLIVGLALGSGGACHISESYHKTTQQAWAWVGRDRVECRPYAAFKHTHRRLHLVPQAFYSSGASRCWSKQPRPASIEMNEQGKAPADTVIKEGNRPRSCFQAWPSPGHHLRCATQLRWQLPRAVSSQRGGLGWGKIKINPATDDPKSKQEAAVQRFG